MKAQRQGVRSTKKNAEPTEDEDDNKDDPPLEAPRPHLERAKNHQVACGIIATNDLKGTVCTDLPGRFPFTSDMRIEIITYL